ncbi:MAG: MFS transporter [Alphaproteobacteria bacterium]|nr:MAG: MFS transporter [Alphaproteobacteria bacterium]
MIEVLKGAWALLFGVMLLMVGNGMQGTLLGLRGEIEGFSTYQMSVVMSGYFAGFLFGSRMAPEMIRRVGHVRVFAALGSFVSAILILFPVFTDPVIWTLLRVALGFSFSGVYITAESWLNHAASNETRGQALSAYLVVQMVGIIAAQGLILVDDPGGFVLFILPSVLVSLAFAPILLTVSPTPAFEATRRMSLRELFRISPLGVVGVLIMGGVFSAEFGMAAVFGTEQGLTTREISLFISAIYVGGLVLQFPIGWLSDRLDRRTLIIAVALVGAVTTTLPLLVPDAFPALLLTAFFLGGTANPLYALLIAYTNDFLEVEDMPSASSGLMFVNGIGAVSGPLATGWFMGVLGPLGYFAFIALVFAALVGYGLWRATRRPAPSVEETHSYAPVLQSASPVVLDMAQEIYAEAAEEAEEAEGGASQAPEGGATGTHPPDRAQF